MKTGFLRSLTDLILRSHDFMKAVIYRRSYLQSLVVAVACLLITACMTFPIASYQTPDVLTPGDASGGIGVGLTTEDDLPGYWPRPSRRHGFRVPLWAEEGWLSSDTHYVYRDLSSPELFFRYGLSHRMDIGVRFSYSPSYDGFFMMHSDLKRQILAEPFKLAIDLGMSWTRFGSRIPARVTITGPFLSIESANGSTVAKTDITDRSTPMTLTGIYPMILFGYGRFYSSAKWMFLRTSDGWHRDWPGLSIGYRIGSRFQLLPEVTVVFAESVDQYGGDLSPMVWYSLGILLNARK